MSDAMNGAAPSFDAMFGRPATVIAEAPGRVNLIGEHTDYSDGFVLPMAIPLRTRVALAPRSDKTVRLRSANLPTQDPGVYVLGDETRTRGWIDYVQGVTLVLRREGCAIRGFDAYVSSSVPVGSGLSSSAALEIGVLRALREAFGLALDDVSLARIGRAAENDFVGAPVGIMDQMASSLADERSALFLDTRSLAFERIPFPVHAELVIIDSGVAHDHATGDYKTRRAETERAAGLLGVPALRDVDISRLSEIDRLPHPLDRRARHVVTENARVLEAVAAMRAGSVERLGALLLDSHASMRDDFEVSVDAVDRLVTLLGAEDDVYGARLTGGGFGGAVIALVRKGRALDIVSRVMRKAPGGARVLLPAPSPGGLR